MSNEELARRVQEGERAELLELWGQVRRFALQQARRWVQSGRGGVMEEDLMQTAFLALLDALEGWDCGKGAFLTWFGVKLKSAFSEATAQRTQRDRLDPLDHAESLETPLRDDPDAGTLADMIPDPAAERAVDAVGERDFLLRRQAAVRQALDSLPEDQRRAVVLRHWYGQRADMKAYNSALRALRHPRVSRQLRAFLA